MVQAVFDYRNARQAIELFNSGRQGVEALSQNPQLARVLVEMRRAQGTADTLEGVVADMEARGAEEEETF